MRKLEVLPAMLVALILTVAALAATLPPTSLPAGLPPGLVHGAFGKKLFQDLAIKLEGARPSDLFSVVVFFNRPIWHNRLQEISLMRRLMIYRVFSAERALALIASKSAITALAALPVVRTIQEDVPVEATRAWSQRTSGVSVARQALGLDGAGVTIAVVDTGIDGKHMDFNDSDGHSNIIGWVDLINHKTTPYDDNGHGTHVASIAAGRLHDAVGGVAYAASIVGVKVLKANGSTNSSTVAAGVDWCREHRDQFHIQVINLSLGEKGSGSGDDVISQAIDLCVDAGIVVCVAAGNDGPKLYTVGDPGACEKAITVANCMDYATDYPLSMFRFGPALYVSSSRGPTADGRPKPDLGAPGVYIIAAKAGTTAGTTALTGTSMASPFVAGVCALLLQRIQHWHHRRSSCSYSRRQFIVVAQG